MNLIWRILFLVKNEKVKSNFSYRDTYYVCLTKCCPTLMRRKSIIIFSEKSFLTIFCIASIVASQYDFFVAIMSCILSNSTTTFNHEIYSLRQAMTQNVCPCKIVSQIPTLVCPF